MRLWLYTNTHYTLSDLGTTRQNDDVLARHCELIETGARSDLQYSAIQPFTHPLPH